LSPGSNSGKEGWLFQNKEHAMSTNSTLSKFLRFLAILLMSLTGGFTLLGGIGTSCVAINPAGFGESMTKLAPLQWLYIVFVLTGIVLGLLGIRAAFMLIRGRVDAYRDSLAVLVAGLAIGIIHIATSRALRGASMPVDAVVYITILTLAVFLALKIPAICQRVDFTKSRLDDNKKAGGAAAILLGLLALTIQHSMGATHTWNGVNYADMFNPVMTGAGTACLLSGVVVLFKPRWQQTNTGKALLPRETQETP
jgi:hypothetical protein